MCIHRFSQYLSRPLLGFTAAAAVSIGMLSSPAEAQRSFTVGEDTRVPWREHVPPDPIGPTFEREAWPFGAPHYWDPIRQVWVRGLGIEHRYRQYDAPLDNPALVRRESRQPPIQVIGGRIDDIRFVRVIERHPHEPPHNIVQVRLKDGRTFNVDLGPHADARDLGLTRGSEFILSGDRRIVDGLPVVVARHVVVDQDVVLADRRPLRDDRYAPPPLAYVEPDVRDRPLAYFESDEVDRIIADWPEPSRRAADDMIRKYGMPQEYTESMLVWHDNGPWRRTVVHRVPVPHDFPAPHLDVIEQTIGYRISAQRLPNLAIIGAHVSVNTVRGEATAFCESEAANFLTLNLMHDVIVDRLTLAEARRRFEEQMRAYRAGYDPIDMHGLRFDRPEDAVFEPEVRPPMR